MAAAARRATLTAVGLASKRLYNVNMYISDVAAAFVTMNANGQAGTGSPTYYILPEDCVIADLSIASGLTDTTLLTMQANNAIVPGVVLQYADFLNTITTRPALGLKAPKGTQIAFVQS